MVDVISIYNSTIIRLDTLMYDQKLIIEKHMQ